MWFKWHIFESFCSLCAETIKENNILMTQRIGDYPFECFNGSVFQMGCISAQALIPL
jgi:hypothetical protein